MRLTYIRVVVALPWLAAGSALAACPPLPADGTVLRQGNLQLAWRPVIDGSPQSAAAIPMARPFGLDIQLCEGDAAAKARLAKVDATMPEHRHGMNYRPRISAVGDGRYRVEGLMFHMSGRWQLEFELNDGNQSQRLFHDVKVR